MHNINRSEMNEAEISKKVNPKKIILPILIGLISFLAILYFQLKGKTIPFEVLTITPKAIFWLIMATVFMLTRDIGYIIRLKILSNQKLSWWQATRVIFLWEFASAVSPSAVGGTSVAVIFVHKEGINIGQSSAIVMATSFLDELYFIIAMPILILITGLNELFVIGNETSYLNTFFYFAIIGYFIKFAYIIVLSYGLFVNPKVIKNIILKIFGLKVLRKWRKQARRAGMDIITNSNNLKKQSLKFWIKTFLATAISWTARYWIVNAIFIAFFVLKKTQFLLFARQLVMWIMMLISPTPGGSGFSEFIFTQYLSDFIPQLAGIAIIMAFIWRLYTYYPYLLIGSIILPNWLKTKFNLKNKTKQHS